MMADERLKEIERECVAAFKRGNKGAATNLVPFLIQLPDVHVSTTFQSLYNPNHYDHEAVAKVSLLHLAAYWGWRDIAGCLVADHNYSATLKDDEGHISLHYAAYKGHLHLVRYFIAELLCDSMEKNKYGNEPIHYACCNGHLHIVQYLIREAHCKPSCVDRFGNTPLHNACSNGQLNIVKYLFNEAHCDPSCENNRGDTPIHHACRNGHLNIAQYLFGVAKCNPSCKDSGFRGCTPLHYASRNGHINVVQYLISKAHCNPSCEDKYGNTALHDACNKGHLNIVQYLISESHCIPSCKNHSGSTPLHCACSNGHLNIVQYLISEAHCNPSSKDNYHGNTPLHGACSSGCLNIVKYLINEAYCDPLCENNIGSTPLHNACVSGHLNIVQYLISEAHCNPSCKTHSGWTPLHYACHHNHTSIVQYLLSTGCVDPLAENTYQHTPLFLATGKYDILKLFQPFVDCCRDFPVHTFSKLILTGDSGAGKTTIAQLIKFLANRVSSAVAIDFFADVQRFTAGIIPHHIESELGNFVVYDFAGQQEYYSSHAAILEQVMRKSAAMFFCIIDLSKSIDNISQSLHYWLTFIDNACSTAEEMSHVAIIGSHLDQVESSKEIEEKSSVLKSIVASRVKHQISFGYVAMDCRRADTDGSCELISILSNSHKAITANQPSISYYCHVLYAFLRTKLGVVGCKLDDLMSVISSENDSSLPKDSSVLTELLTILSDKGLILFIQHSQPKWVVVKTEVLLTEINGELFRPHSLKVYPDLASNTGVIPASSLHKIFDQYDKEMLIGFLVALDFCRPVDPLVLRYTNLHSASSCSMADLLFFPSLVQSERPGSLIQHSTLQFGWCLGCLDRNQFFGTRFLHLLLLSVAYQFPLAVKSNITPSLCGSQQRCTIWKNGISWRNSDAITTVVELIDKNRWVLVAMSCSKDRPVEFAKLRSKLISLVCHLQQEHCQSLKVCECLISPSLVQRYPFNDLSDSNLFDIKDVATSILCQKPLVCSQNTSEGDLPTHSLLPIEPYLLINPSYVCRLFNTTMANQPVPAPLSQELQKHFHKVGRNPHTYKELREEMNKLSIFAGRNPLVSSFVSLGNVV